MAVASLKYDANSGVDETKSGVFVYDGSAGRYHEWEFRTTIRWKSRKEEDRLQALGQIIDGLRGEAALVAMDLGQDVLMKPDGAGRLRQADRCHAAASVPTCRS